MNARTKASLKILVVMIIATVLFTSCGQPAVSTTPDQSITQVPEGSSTDVATVQPKVKIVVWEDTLDADAASGTTCYQENLVTPFNAQSETTEVEVTLLANPWEAQLTALQGGAGPDVVEAPGPALMGQLAKADMLYPLDEFAVQFDWNTALDPWALKLGVVDGKLFSLPNQVETVVLFYNKTLFEQHGWQPPKTIDELLALAEEIQAAGIMPFAHANADWKGVNEWFVGEILNHDAGPQKVYDALTGALPWTDPSFQTSIDILNEMQQKGWFMGGMDRYYTTTDGERLQAFADGKAAMSIEGTWAIESYIDYFGEFSAINADWGWTPTPSKSGDPIFDLGIGNSYGINSKTAHPENVAEFLNYLYSPDTQSILLEKCGSVPGPVKLNKDLLTNQDPRYLEILDLLNAAAASNNVGYTTWTFWPPKCETYMIDNIENVWAGTMTSQEYLAGLQTLFSEEMNNGDVPPIPAR